MVEAIATLRQRNSCSAVLMPEMFGHRSTEMRIYGFYEFMAGGPMKTTVEVPDDLYRRAKAEAALRGRKLKDLIEEGLRLVLETPGRPTRHPSLAELMKRGRGMVDSGVPDLASNPEHLAGFGRDGRRDR
jgi:hypothetical protein